MSIVSKSAPWPIKNRSRRQMLLLKWPPHIKNNGRATRYARVVREFELGGRSQVERSFCLLYLYLETKTGCDGDDMSLNCHAMIRKKEESRRVL